MTFNCLILTFEVNKFTRLRALAFLKPSSILQTFVLLVMALIPASWALVKSFMGFRAKCNDAIDSVSAYNFKIHCITEIWLNDIYFLVHEHMS